MAWVEPNIYGVKRLEEISIEIRVIDVRCNMMARTPPFGKQKKRTPRCKSKSLAQL
jgi:hypothetical protein